MASIQNQTDSHQRPSVPTSRSASASASPNLDKPRTRAPSVVSEDSQVVLLNDPHNSHPSVPAKSDQPTSQLSSPPKPLSPASEPRKCWICLATEIEDTPTSSSWRTPCPCALTAHERCLLDWVAQLEDPRHSRRNIECPQCKAKITIARPRSYIAESILALESAGGRLVVPIILFTVAGGVLTGFWVHGCTSILLVFGIKDGEPLLGFAAGYGSYPSTDLFLPLIPILLIASRTTMADGILKVLPIFLLYSHASTWSASSKLWPPSPAVTFATLPYIRSTYNAFYDYFFAPRKKAWLKELEPRRGEHGEGPANENNQAPEEQEEEAHEHMIEIGVEIQLMAGDDVPDRPLAAEAPPAQPMAENPPAAQVQAAPRERPQLDLVGSSLGVADKIVGALLFPALSAGMGELLKLALPYTWRTPPQIWERRSAGLLQTRWGRSVVGGCLVVLLKDSMVLYSRYRLAQIQRRRTVLDWPGKGRSSGGA